MRLPASETPLLDRLNAAYRHRYLVVSVFLIVVLATAIKTYTTIPMYSAATQILINEEWMADITGFADPVSRDPYADPEPYYQTQYRILTGRELARRVIGDLHLADIQEFSGQGAQPTQLGQLLTALRTRATAPLRLLAPGPAGAEGATDAGPTDTDLADAFASRVTIAPVPKSRLVEVSFVAADPEFAARAVNVLAEAYVTQNLEVRRATIQNSLEWLSDELDRQQQKVEDGERALAQYREEQNALSLEDRQNIVVARLNQLNDAVTRAKTNRVQKETLYQQARAVDPLVAPESMPAILQNPYIQSIKARVADLQRERGTLMQRYGDKYPDVIKVNASLEDAIAQLAQEVSRAVQAIHSDYESALAEERILNAALEEQKQAAMDLNRKSVGYTVIEREAESNRLLYETLLQREKELQVVSNGRGNNVRIVEPARVPAAPFDPTPRRDLTLAAVVGLVLAFGLAFGIEYLDNTVKTPEDVRRLRLPMLGLIPAIKGRKAPAMAGSTFDQFGESFRALRTSLALTAASDGTRVVLVTSAQPLEGKTTTACNLARALAHGGARVLLIDTDMRRPGVHGNFGLDNTHGLSDVLSGRAPITQVVQRLAAPDLWVLTAGVVPPNPSELLGSHRMKALMSNARRGPFDWVILDTPPVMAVTDAVILTPWVTGVALVVRSEMTSRWHVDRVLETLAPSRPQILGVVLNRVDIVRNRYYYSRYYGHAYEKYVRAAA